MYNNINYNNTNESHICMNINALITLETKIIRRFSPHLKINETISSRSPLDPKICFVI
jgi:hypothetical protein